MRLALLALAFPVLLADVMPHCGPPRVVIRQAGDDCGHHGPRWRGDCVAPSVCMVGPNGPRCTASCATDADCGILGAGFACTIKARPYDSTSAEPVQACAKAE